jgi:hypothetical protein
VLISKQNLVFSCWKPIASSLFEQTPLLGEPSLSPSSAAIVATAVPTFQLSKFDWDITSVGDAIVVFSESTALKEIILRYFISNRDFQVSVLEQNCLTPVPESVIAIWSESIIATSTHSNLTVHLDVKLDAMARTSPIWMDVGDRQVKLLLCIRVDLMLPDDADGSIAHAHHDDDGAAAETTSWSSINFHEQVLHALLPSYVRSFPTNPGPGTNTAKKGSRGAEIIIMIVMILVVVVSICCLAHFISRRRLAHSVEDNSDVGDNKSDPQSDAC